MTISKSKDISFFLYSVYCALIMFCPIVPGGVEHVVFFLWLLVALFSIRVDRVGQGYRGLLLFVLFYFICSLFTEFVTAINRTVGLLGTFSPFLAFYLYRKNDKKAFHLSLMLIGIILFDALYAMLTIPSFEISGMRSVRSVTADVDQDLYRNGFDVIYSSSMMISIFIYSLKNRNHWALNGISRIALTVSLIAAIVFLTVFIVLSQYMFAIIIVFLGIALTFVYGRKRWVIKSILITLIGISCFNIFYSNIVSYIGTDTVTEVFLNSKLEEVHNVLTGNSEEAEDANSRGDHTLSSIIAFGNNPIVGVFYQAKTTEERIKLGVGSHSEWFDMLALYGMFAFLIFRFVYFRIKEQKQFVPCLLHILLYVIVGFLNPLWNAFNNIAIFFVAPVFMIGLFNNDNVEKRL